jgi:type I restriction enzyme, S subunit
MNRTKLLLKQARISSIPDKWKITRVGECCSIRNDLRKPISVDERNLIQGVYPYYGPTGILDYINEFLVEGVFALIGEDGDHFLKPDEKQQSILAHGKFNVNNHAHLIESTKTCSAQWFSVFFKHRNITDFLSRQGANRYKLNKATLEKLPILIPPLPEQKAIANLLSAWNETIEKTELLIQANKNRLEAFGIELFSRKNDGKYKGWKLVKLKDVLIEHEDKSTGNEKVFSVSVHKGLVNQIKHLGRSFSATNTDNYNCVHYGDIVYTKSPTGYFPLGVVKQSYTSKDVIVSPLYGVFSPISFDLGVVIDYYFNSPIRARNYLFPIIQKGAKNTIAITNKTFLSKKIHLPVDATAQKIVSEYVNTARKEIDLLKQLADKYKTQKRGLMQKLLTGEWRMLPEVIIQYEET